MAMTTHALKWFSLSFVIACAQAETEDGLRGDILGQGGHEAAGAPGLANAGAASRGSVTSGGDAGSNQNGQPTGSAGASNGTAGSDTGSGGAPDTGGSGSGGSPASGGTPGSGGTSGDGCNGENEFRIAASDHCYYLDNSTGRTWQGAQDICSIWHTDGDLVAYSSQAEFSEVNSAIKSLHDANVHTWTGGNDSNLDGDFVWTNGEEWSFARWNEGAPEPSPNNTDCVVFYSQWGVMDDVSCSQLHFTVCERR